MQGQARTKQGGSVVNFLIVGVVLAALVLGAIYIAQHRGKTDTATPNAPSVAVNSGNPTSGGSPSAQPSQSTAPSSSPKPSTTSQPSTSPKPSSTPTPAPAPAENLPATGPADDLIVSSLPIAAIVALVAAYVQSRRAHRQATSY